VVISVGDGLEIGGYGDLKGQKRYRPKRRKWMRRRRIRRS